GPFTGPNPHFGLIESFYTRTTTISADRIFLWDLSAKFQQDSSQSCNKNVNNWTLYSHIKREYRVQEELLSNGGKRR
ncbi:hypothetical protein, partial [Mesobacillus boroniphilus]|uniref:hypothetical protein n=1 Tax=Mesobacillus boroniphilus TaxID=308892 RepID=UPI0005514FAC